MLRKKTATKTEGKTKKTPLTTAQVDVSLKSDAQRMKEHLEAQPKVSFLIPLLPGEPEGSYETVCLNGYLMQIKKGVLVELPEQVAEILANKYNVEMSAGSEKLVSRSPKVEEALN